MVVDKVPVELRDAVSKAWKDRKANEPELKKWQVYLELVSKVNALPNPDAMFEFLYNNINIFKNIPNSIIAIADGQYKSETVRDKNLNLCATLVNLSQWI